MKSKKTKRRNLIVLIAAIVALVLLSASLVFALRSAIADEETSDKTTSSSSSSAPTEPEEPEEPSTETDPPESGEGDIEIETSEENLKLQSAIKFVGSSLNPPVQNNTTLKPDLSFNFRLSNITKLEIEASYDLKILIATKTDFERLNPSKLDYVDWLPLFKQSNYSYKLEEPTAFEKDGDAWFTRGVIKDVSLNQYNTEYFAVAVLDTGEGYQYTSFAGYEEEARSVAYIASLVLADNALAEICGYTTESAWRLVCFNAYIVGSANLALGYDSVVLSKAQYTFNAGDTSISMKVNDTQQINYSQTPSGVRLGYRFFTLVCPSVWTWKEDDSIIKVSEDGVITAVGKGTAYVLVCGGGDTMVKTVTVS